MTDQTTSADKPADPAAPTTGAAETPAVDEWKPEPRQWTWKDLFTAPMLAFKPKCMLVMAVTAILLSLWYKYQPSHDAFGSNTPRFVSDSLGYIWHAIALIIFGISASFVAIFMKADLLDDEFLTFGEAFSQWKGRILSAVLVPVFMTGIYGAFTALLAGCELIGSIPVVGPAIYAILYPLGLLLSIFISLLFIALILSIFVFPSIVAIRKHGWFDNVVDTFEAVGTKPHVLVGSALMTFVMISISGAIAFGAMDRLYETSRYMPGKAMQETENRANYILDKSTSWLRADGYVDVVSNAGNFVPRGYLASISDVSGWHTVTGTVTGIWKTFFTAIFIGYLGNLFIAGGMLTYLSVREDDYWDDEDLEDLDKLAKELEDEAKAEAAKATDSKPAAAPEAAKPADAAPATPAVEAPPAADRKTADTPDTPKPDGDKPTP